MSNPRADSVLAMQDILNAANRQLLDNMTISNTPQHSVSATELLARQKAATKQLQGKSVFPKLWSDKLLEEFARDTVMGEFLKPELVGPDWPQYAGVQENLQKHHARVAAKALCKVIDDHVLDSLVYGVSALHVNVKS